MRLRIVALGHRMPAWVSEGVAQYTKRMPRELPVDLVELKPGLRNRGHAVPRVLADEAQRLAAGCMGTRVVALDEHGAQWTTRALADRLTRWRDEGVDVSFVIGSADGLDEGFKATAESVIAVSAMTLPHGLARILLAEQLYRAASLNAGHPYHRE